MHISKESYEGGVGLRQRVYNECRSCGKRIPSGLTKCLACSLNLRSGGKKGNCKCRVCGSDVEVNDVDCQICGTNFTSGSKEEVKTTSSETEEYVCMICGRQVDKKARRCDFCGTVFIDDSDVHTGPVVERLGDGPIRTKGHPSPG
jgi:hypothetical protein